MRRYIFLLFCLLISGSAAARDGIWPEFTLKDLDGRDHSLSDYRGRWVIVNYWATWCPPCLEEMPELEVFYNNHKDTNAVVLGLNMEDIATEKLKKWADDQFLSFPILRDRPRGETELGRIHGLPSTYIVNPQGRLVARQIGPVTAKLLEEFIAASEPSTNTTAKTTP
ncbi:MAG: TlpA family protein disulfide reductase [Chromatiales bacterium]|nr:TlpA family protein disulfide reductase [Chromatiales bacterium]